MGEKEENILMTRNGIDFEQFKKGNNNYKKPHIMALSPDCCSKK